MDRLSFLRFSTWLEHNQFQVDRPADSVSFPHYHHHHKHNHNHHQLTYFLSFRRSKCDLANGCNFHLYDHPPSNQVVAAHRIVILHLNVCFDQVLRLLVHLAHPDSHLVADRHRIRIRIRTGSYSVSTTSSNQPLSSLETQEGAPLNGVPIRLSC